MAFCSGCGALMAENKNFCTKCGKANFTANDINLAKANDKKETDVINELPFQNKTPLQKIFSKNAIIASSFVALLSLGIYFFFLTKKPTNTLYVLAQTLKLRNTTNDISEANVLDEGKFGTPINVLNDEGDWLKVELNGQKGYMAKKYLANAADYFEIEAFLKNLGTIDTITSTRFKLSILNYLHKNNLTSNLSQENIETYFKNDKVFNSKEKWQVVNQNEAYYKSFVTGKFTNSKKEGIAILIENVTQPSKRKLILFNYSDNESEIETYTQEANNFEYLQKVDKGEYNASKYFETLKYDGILLEKTKRENSDIDAIIFDGIKMQKTFFNYDEPGC